MGLVDKQDADAKKTAAKAAAKEAKAAAKAATAKEQADSEMKDAAEPDTEVNGEVETENTKESPKEATTEEAPATENTSKFGGESSVPAAVEDQSSKPEDAESGINGQSTADRITSVLTGAFLAN